MRVRGITLWVRAGMAATGFYTASMNTRTGGTPGRSDRRSRGHRSFPTFTAYQCAYDTRIARCNDMQGSFVGLPAKTAWRPFTQGARNGYSRIHTCAPVRAPDRSGRGVFARTVRGPYPDGGGSVGRKQRGGVSHKVVRWPACQNSVAAFHPRSALAHALVAPPLEETLRCTQRDKGASAHPRAFAPAPTL